MARLSVAIVACTLVACGGGGGGGSAPPPTTTPPPPVPPPAVDSFANATQASNMSWVTQITAPSIGGSYPREVGAVTFGGAAAGDCDADGDVDLFITYGDGGANRLYLNQLDTGNPLLFMDAADSAGVAYTRDPALPRNDRHSGPTFADMDGDGHLDLIMGGIYSDANKVYQNQGDCTFEDVTADAGLASLQSPHTISAGFGDYDLDGDLDLFLTHWASRDDFAAGEPTEHLFENVSTAGEIRFVDVSLTSGVSDLLRATRQAYASRSDEEDWSLAPTFAHINDDLWPDIALAADFNSSQVLLNDPDNPGSFLDGSSPAIHDVEYGMGSALGDFDFDGDLDWFVTSIYSGEDATDEGVGNFLYENPGGDFSVDRFTKIPSGVSGVADGSWGWAACFLDIDNDTDLDIYHTNGWHLEYLGRFYTNDESRVFISRMAQGSSGSTFVERASTYGLDDQEDARGVVCADFDNDGDVDILQLTNNIVNSASLWENDSAAAGNNFLRVKLVGLPPNTEAAGARIYLRIGARTQMREIMIGSNYTAQNPTTQIFGLGTASSVDELRIEWPARVPALGADPVQPADTLVAASAINANLGVSGATLVVCHPDLVSPPVSCM